MDNNQNELQCGKKNYTFLLLLLGLLLLRFPFQICLDLNKLPISGSVGSNVFREGTYLIIAMLIFLKRNALSNYNIDLYALTIFIAAPIARLFAEYYLMGGYVQPDTWFEIIVSICLLIALLIYRPKIQKRKIKDILIWLLISVAVGICVSMFYGKVSSLQTAAKGAMQPTASWLVVQFVISLSNAAAMEEPLFRGFLWGFLRGFNWKEHWIWLFQSVLFWLGHIYYLGVFNYSFWIVVPVGGLVFGFIAWRSKSIGTSMIVHGIGNSLSGILANYNL